MSLKLSDGDANRMLLTYCYFLCLMRLVFVYDILRTISFLRNTLLKIYKLYSF